MFSAETLQKFAREVAKYPADQKQSASMACLAHAQEEKGWLAPESIEAVALLAKTGTAFPDMVFDHADHQIGAGSFIVDAVKAGFVEKLFVLL